MQQMDIFEVFEEQKDFETVREQIESLKPGQSILTNTIEVHMLNKFIEVECIDICHELFYQKEDVIAFVGKTLNNGVA